MGTTISKITASIGVKPPESRDPMDFDHYGDGYEGGDRASRPNKRRKLNFPGLDSNTMDDDSSMSRQPLGQLTSSNERARGAKPGMVQPSDFYGKSKSKQGSLTPASSKKTPAPSKNTKARLDDLLPQSPAEFTKALRVDVQEINLKSSSEFPSEIVENEADIPCRVGVAIYRLLDEEKQFDFVEICKITKDATLCVTVTEDGEVLRKLVLSEPFYFLPGQLFVTRKTRRPNGQWGGYETLHVYDFADRCRIVVTVEPTKFHIEWPALHIPGDGPVSQAINDGSCDACDFQLRGKSNLFGSAERLSTIPLTVMHSNPGREDLRQAIPYTLAIRTQWTIPNTLRNAIPETPKTMLKAMPPVSASPATYAPTGDDTGAEPADMSTVDSTLAASRARRDRSAVATYNLKTLSVIAQGKSPRKRKLKDAFDEESGAITVTYSLHQGEAAEVGVKQRTIVTGLACVFCNAKNQTVDELRLHLHTDHGNFKFSYRHGPPQVKFFIEIVKPRSGPMVDIERGKTFQLTKPRTLFDLENYLSGEAWTKARHGPQHGLWPSHLQERAHEPSSSASPHDSRYSSPNTSHSAEEDEDDAMDDKMYEEKPPERKRKTFLVPKTAKPLYHPITKQRLIPGEELPDSDEERDESWLHQKHRDLVNDFSDVTEDEKDYIIGWNKYIVERHLTSTKYLPAEVIKFVRMNLDWFLERSTRKREFSLHMKVFILRGDIPEDILWDSLDIIKEAEDARAQREKDNVGTKPEPEQPVRKSRAYLQCICGKHTTPPWRVMCAGDCKNRMFCEECAESYGRPVDKNWLCNECFSPSS